eukprot:292673-Prorocentrum_minimum.AAC.1
MSYKHALVSPSPSASEGEATVTDIVGAGVEDDVQGDCNAESVPASDRREATPAKVRVGGGKRDQGMLI